LEREGSRGRVELGKWRSSPSCGTDVDELQKLSLPSKYWLCFSLFRCIERVRRGEHVIHYGLGTEKNGSEVLGKGERERDATRASERQRVEGKRR